ncbi:MAG: cobyrinate a,c-diamide synthase, partial [Dehalococcoidia bacterium]|nr:cobyrinate a,c-diamide synthase [Dehalococcoidia bacterium]
MGCVVIAGVSSSVGKTTVAVGIMDALQRRGLKVQPFKIGPDYIDPGYHTIIVEGNNRQSRNLDSWMIPPPALLELFNRAMRGADIGLIEGVMGLYDGYSSADDTGSTAQVAKLLGSPVILVIDVSHTSRSAAATVLGFKQFDPQVNIAGVVLNFVGSANHLQSVTEAITNSVGVPVIGYLSRHSELVLPERHLGLIPTAEKTLQLEFRNRLASAIEANFNIGYIETLAKR